MNITAIHNETANTYWRFLRNLSDGVKLRLITLLSQSISSNTSNVDMSNTNRKTKLFLEEFCGAWKGEASADDLVRVIEESRSSKNPISFK